MAKWVRNIGENKSQNRRDAIIDRALIVIHKCRECENKNLCKRITQMQETVSRVPDMCPYLQVDTDCEIGSTAIAAMDREVENNGM